MKNTCRLLVLLACFLYTTGSIAQVNLLQAEEHILQANINLAKDELSAIQSNSKATIALKDGELNIYFPVKPNNADQFYNVNVSITLDGQEINPMEEGLTGFIGSKLSTEIEGRKSIIWTNLVDTYKQLKGKLEVKINVELRGALQMTIDCNNPPTFTRKDKMPFLIGAGVGLLSIGAGQIFKDRRDDIYDNDYLNSSSTEESEPFYDDANGNHHAYLILSYTGAAILITDAVWYFVKRGKYKKQLKIHKKFCNGNEVTLRPMIQLPVQTAPATSGIRLTARF
ncbi:MAG: hypothetical protein AB8F74_10850 [Saprospiraceae bacterium]